MERTQSVAPGPTPVAQTPTSKMSFELQEALFRKHNMSKLYTQSIQDLQLMKASVLEHIQRLKGEIRQDSTEGKTDLQKTIDLQELKEYKQGINEVVYCKQNQYPDPMEVYHMLVKTTILMDNLGDTIKLAKNEVKDDPDIPEEERREKLLTITEDLKTVNEHWFTLQNIIDYIYSLQ